MVGAKCVPTILCQLPTAGLSPHASSRLAIDFPDYEYVILVGKQVQGDGSDHRPIAAAGSRGMHVCGRLMPGSGASQR